MRVDTIPKHIPLCASTEEATVAFALEKCSTTYISKNAHNGVRQKNADESARHLEKIKKAREAYARLKDKRKLAVPA